MSEYTKQAEDFLKDHGLEFSAVLVGSDCPRFCEDHEKEQATQRQVEYRIDQFPRKTHIHGKHYRCTISGKNRGQVSFDFWNSYADEEYNALGGKKYHNGGRMLRYWETKGKRKLPQAYDLLACLTKSDPGTFRDFCAEFGYDTDSRKAFDVYQAVQDEYSKVRRFFKSDEIKALQEIA